RLFGWRPVTNGYKPNGNFDALERKNETPGKCRARHFPTKLIDFRAWIAATGGVRSPRGRNGRSGHEASISRRSCWAGGIREDGTGGPVKPAIVAEVQPSGGDERHLHKRGRGISVAAGRASRRAGAGRGDRRVPACGDTRGRVNEFAGDRGIGGFAAGARAD